MELISVNHEFSKPKEAKRIFRDDKSEITHIKLTEGEAVPEHDSPKDVFIFVNTGRVEFTVNDEKHIIDGETILHMDPKERHALKAVSDVSLFVMKC